MYPQTPDQINQTDEKPAIHNPLQAMQPGERIVCEIKRHPIGMLGIYIGAGILLVVLAVITLIVGPNLITSGNQSQGMVIGALIFVVFAALCLVFVFISNKVYWGNSWVVTSDSITQMTQRSLFDKRSSQLSFGNLEDVTAEQKGVLAHLLNYGVLRAETAGERSKFLFSFCPNPNNYAQKILNAREQFEQSRQTADPQQQYHTEEAQSAAPASQPQPSYYPPLPVPPMPPSSSYNPHPSPGADVPAANPGSPANNSDFRPGIDQ